MGNLISESVIPSIRENRDKQTFAYRDIMSEEVQKFKITIDGQTTEVAPGTSILLAARQIGGKSVPPAMCY